MKINLGTVVLSKDVWERCKKHGYSREDVKAVILGNGEASLIDALDMSMICVKCGRTAMQGTESEDCQHEWNQK